MTELDDPGANRPSAAAGAGPIEPGSPPKDRNWLPWVTAVIVVVAVVALLAVLGRRPAAQQQAAQPGMAAPDPYATKLLISNVKMSEASNFAGSKVTYLEGHVTNNGDKVLKGITTQVAFRNALGEIAQKDTLPMMLIRTREPYVDIEPVEAAPVQPGGEADFRLVFDHVAEDWNQQYPEVRAIRIEFR